METLLPTRTWSVHLWSEPVTWTQTVNGDVHRVLKWGSLAFS